MTEWKGKHNVKICGMQLDIRWKFTILNDYNKKQGTLQIFSLFWFCNNQGRLNIWYIKTMHVSPDLVLCLGLVL